MAESHEQALQIADVYAEALFALARQAGQIAETRSELEELVRLEEADKDFAAFMRSGVVDDDSREASLEKMFRGRLSDVVLNTLQIMNHHDRAGLLPALLRCYVLHQERDAGQVEVLATSAVELDETQRAAIKRWAAESSGCEPLVNYAVDPEIIGGLVVQIGGQRYDHSVRYHLRSAQAKLLDRSDRGLNVGIEPG